MDSYKHVVHNDAYFRTSLMLLCLLFLKDLLAVVEVITERKLYLNVANQINQLNEILNFMIACN